MSDYPMLISNKLHSFRNFQAQIYQIPHNTRNRYTKNFLQEKCIKKRENNLRCFLLRAENETRTRDPNLGKVMLYQLSYFRKNFKTKGSGKRDSNSRP